MNNYPGGVYPVMLTPMTTKGEIDEQGLRALIDWYIDHGVNGLFASCQSSEIYKLNFDERMEVAKITVDQAKGRVPVVASGHTSDDFEDQVRELNTMAETGVNAVITITNHAARADESDDVWMKNMDRLLEKIDPAVHLGAYECPTPYKRLMTPGMIKHIARAYRDRFSVLRAGTGESPLTLPFYEKCGFEAVGRIENFFTDNYDHTIIEGGVRLRDMVILERRLKDA